MNLDFGDDSGPLEWTIESLNARLLRLKVGETLRIDDLSNDIYHGCFGVSCSKLKLFMECPYKYYAHFVEKSVPYVHKRQFDFGNAGHTTILEPEKFKSTYVREPDYSGAGSKAKMDHFYAQSKREGKTVLKAEDYDFQPYLTKAIARNKYATRMTQGGVSEVSFFTLDAETGLIVKVRPDYMIGDMITDLKTTVAHGLKAINRAFKNLNYHLQDAMYSDIAGADYFYFIAIEKVPPFIVTAPIEFPEGLKRIGYLKYRKAMRDLKNCMDTGVWPSYTNEKHVIEMTKFERNELEKLEQEI